jgi:hypothetical protein
MGCLSGPCLAFWSSTSRTRPFSSRSGGCSPLVNLSWLNLVRNSDGVADGVEGLAEVIGEPAACPPGAPPMLPCSGRKITYEKPANPGVPRQVADLPPAGCRGSFGDIEKVRNTHRLGK